MSQATIDRSECDREPIHVPGSVQPHGVLLVTDPSSLRILQVAGAIERILDCRIETICGHTVAEVLGMHAASQPLRKLHQNPSIWDQLP
jgi:two-component system, chemotaxis family, sensor kinase Cph1